MPEFVVPATNLKAIVVPNVYVFFRKKTINGSEYWYLVENRREDGKVRQKVIKYIGDEDKLNEFLAGAPR